ncbi:polyprenol phosphomannose-dependent alpha 1,6 mannosyltransferase MptB [Winogradskya humida]|uniref:Alpha-1,6-mannosyltransferase n=1 Tax=Winogradskya humida TaxID=113566 RepID=A0ABQ3ZWQ5_9ACTN|nr:polyprenol phosphomannose-dependent alpha 1,6 mannosyltransferase MptB [Actinoplanes humidus]GIE23020.1 hypothetical protein Ahu01nite_061220 [Actinoplanes humidus]
MATIGERAFRAHDRVAGRRNSAVTGFAVTGFAAAALLAIVTSGFFSPSYGVALSLIAVGMLVLVWLALQRRVHIMRVPDVYRIAVIWALPLTVARPLFSGDLWSYLAQGLTAAKGLDPYTLGPAQALGPDSAVTQHVSHYWVDTPAPYGPVWLTVSRAVAEMAGDNLLRSVLFYRLIALAGVFLIGWALPRLARRGGVSPVPALWLGLLNPLVLWHLVAGAHNDALMIGTMLVGMELALSALNRDEQGGWSRFAAGMTLLTIAACIKVVAVVAICCVAAELARRYGRPVRSALLVLLGAAAGMTVFSSIGGFGWISAMSSSTTVYSWMSPTTGTGLLIGLASGGRDTAAVVTVLNIAGLAVFLLLALRLLLSVYRGRISALRSLGLIFAAMLLCAPVVQPWYLLWALLPLAATTHRHRARVVMIAVSAVVALVTPPLAAAAPHLVVGYLIAITVLAATAAIPAVRRRCLLPMTRRPAETPATVGSTVVAAR